MSRNTTRTARPHVVLAVCSAVCAQQASAREFKTDGGWTGKIDATLSASAGWRVAAADRELIGANDAAIARGYAAAAGTNAAGTANARKDGYLGASNADLAELNYEKGDRYSTLFKAIFDLTLTRGDLGLKLGAKAWYDQALKDSSVRYGNQGNGFNGATSTLGPPAAAGGNVANLTTPVGPRPLSDRGFPALNRFSGVYLRELYVFDRFTLGGTGLDVKAGRQTIAWGSSLFLQGLNQVSPVDLTAVRKPGTDAATEASIPFWALSGKLGLRREMTLEAFYQFRFEPSAVESCGAFFGATDFGYGSRGEFCPVAQVGAGTTGGWAGGVTDTTPDMMLVPGERGGGGDWGLSFRMPLKKVGNFGFYAMDLTSRTPFLSGRLKRGQPNSVGTPPLALWDYAGDIRLYGLTFVTRLAGWRVGAELSHSPNQPVQINPNILVQGSFIYSGVGPVAGAAALRALGPFGERAIALGNRGEEWSSFNGYDRFSKTQLLINGATPISKSVAGVVGAAGGRFAAELGFQKSGVPDAFVSPDGVPGTMLYGRGYIFGLPVPADRCTPSGAARTNPQPQGCLADGFFSPTAWGYRLRAALDYPNVLGSGWQVTPSVNWAHDVKGYSVDTQLNEGRQALTLGIAVNLAKRHEVQFGYATYNRSARYDLFRDRDNFTVTYRRSFP